MVFVVLCQNIVSEGLVLCAQLSDKFISLLEFLLNHPELLWVRKGILRLDDLLKLSPQSDTLVHVEFNFDFELSLSRVLYILPQLFIFRHSFIEFVGKISNSSLQIDDKMRIVRTRFAA